MRVFAFLIVLFSWVGISVVNADEPLTSFRVGDVEVERAVLDNGMRILAVETTNKTADVYLAVAAGKRHETRRTTGLAHLTEHAMFTGTEGVGPQQFEREVRRWGGRANAFTREDYTMYYDTGIPADKLARLLEMEAERLTGLTLEEEAVLFERDRLEREEAATYSIGIDVAERVDAVLFPGHPYGAGLLAGKHTRAPRLPVESVRRFYEDWYHPNRSALVVVAPLPTDETLALARTAFEGLSQQKELGASANTNHVVNVVRGGTIEVASPLRRLRVESVRRLPGLREGGVVQDVFLAAIDRRVQKVEGLTLAADARLEGGLLRLIATPQKGQEFPDFDAVFSNAFETAEIEAVKPALRQAFLRRTLHGRPYFTLPCELAIHEVFGLPRYVVDYSEAVDAVQATNVNDFVERLSPAVFVRLVPETSEEDGPELPDDLARLSQFAETAQAEGRWDDAIAAYTRLYEASDSKMYQVIYLTTRGQVQMEGRRYAGAVDDFKEALSIVDYPAIKPLLEEAERLLEESQDRSVKQEPVPIKPERKQALEEMVPAICREIEEWRGLKFKTPVEVTFTNVTEHEDLQGWYNSETDELVVKVSGGRPRFTRGVLLHELVHALQDQHFDLVRMHRLAGDDPDAQRAVSCLIEGEAIAAVADLMKYDFGAHAELPEKGEIDEERFEKRFTYGRGFAYFNYLRADDGWDAVARAFQNPPLHTAAVLDPDVKRTRSKPDNWDREDGDQTLAGAYNLVQILAEAPELRKKAFELASHVRWGTLSEKGGTFLLSSPGRAKAVTAAIQKALPEVNCILSGSILEITDRD